MGTDLDASHTEFAYHGEVVGEASAADIPSDIDVLVVGFGPVGATIVNLLGRYGVRTLVIDKDKAIFMAPRAIALDNEALRILQLAGIEDGDFDKVAIPYVRMHERVDSTEFAELRRPSIASTPEPRNAPVAFLTHGLAQLARLAPPLRRQLQELEIKPKNAFGKGLFVAGRSHAKVVRGGLLPQGWVRDPDGRIHLSDDALGPSLTLVGFGRDAAEGLRCGDLARVRGLRRQGRADRPSRAEAARQTRGLARGSRRDVHARRRALWLGRRRSPRPHRPSRRPGHRRRPARHRKPRPDGNAGSRRGALRRRARPFRLKESRSCN